MNNGDKSEQTTGEQNEAAAADDNFDPARFFKLMDGHGHGSHIGLTFRDHGSDWVELALPYSKNLIGDPETGILASGPIISMMDNATSLAAWTRHGSFRPQVTLDLRVDYMRPASPGKTIIGRGECYKLTRSVAFVRGVAHDGDVNDPVAHVAGTFIVVENFLA